MKVSQTYSVSIRIAEKLPELKKKIDLNFEFETLILKLMMKNGISVKPSGRK